MTVPYTDLLPTGDEDFRQDCIVALLVHKPTSEEEAIKVLRRCNHRKQWIDRMERKRSMPVLLEQESHQTEPNPTDIALRDAFDRLAPECAALLRQRYEHQRTITDLAMSYGVTRVTIRRRLTAATKELKKYLAVVSK